MLVPGTHTLPGPQRPKEAIVIRRRHLTTVPLLLALAVLSSCDEAPATGPDVATIGDAVAPALDNLPGPPGEASPRKFTLLKARETICELIDFGEAQERNGVTHFRGRTVETRAESDDPRYTGTGHVVFGGWQDENGDGKGHGRITFRPDDIDGTWEGTFTGGWTEFLFTGRSTLHGSGDLRGQTLHIRYQEVVLGSDDPTHPCTPALPDGPQFLETVRIIDPEG